ncbi:MAG: endonuclease MutS2 [Ruminococcaceae bacterium]|nr:endonuclease MutS2 [Oscillospiraceae bacterium]
MSKKSYIKLEFDKIREMLSLLCVIEPNKKKALLIEPFSDAEELNFSLNEVNDACSLILKRGNPPFYSVQDVLAHIKRLDISAVFNTRELLDIGKLLKTTRLLKDYASEDRELSSYFDSLVVLRGLEEEISTKIISEDEIADNASIKLYAIRKKINATHNKIKEVLNKYITSTTYQKYLQDPVVTMRGDRFVLPVKIEHKGEIAGIVHDTSSSGSTVFIEPMQVVEINNSLKEMFLEEEKEIERILFDITSHCGLNREQILNNYNIVCDLDFIFSKAKLSVSMKGTKPVINERGYINLKKARHPLIDKTKVVPIDVILGGQYDSLIVTGPNTGGKTVSLKTVGLLCLMGASGLMIPAGDKSEISLFSHIFADIGDEQSIAQSLSTFSSHMVNIVDIINNVEYNSLILFDELGAGTDPVEGASLAIGIIESLRQKGAKIMATTHYSELKLYALSTKGVINASCEFDVETLRPTYKLIIGTPGKSNAFSISKRLGLPDEILDKAKEQLNEENIKFEDVLSEIEKTRIALKKERELANKFKLESEELKRKLTDEKQKSEEKYIKIIDDANREAKEILEEAKEEAASLIKELRNLRKEESQREFDKKTTKANERISKKIKEANSKIITSKNKQVKAVNPKTLLKGTSVKLIDLDQSATVIELPDKDGNLVVMAGILKIRTNVSNLCIDESEQKKETTYTTFKKAELKNKTITSEIDIRGATVADGVMDAEKYIDDAVMLKLEKVSIIHGKGTGVLRSAIHAMLKKHPNIKSFRLGLFGEGEDGVTIVELK